MASVSESCCTPSSAICENACPVRELMIWMTPISAGFVAPPWLRWASLAASQTGTTSICFVR